VVPVGEVVAVVVAAVVAEDEGGEETVGMDFVVHESIDNLVWMTVYVEDCPRCQFANQNVIPERYTPVDVRMGCNSLHTVVDSFQCPFPSHQDQFHVAGVVAASYHLVQRLSPAEGIHDQVPWGLGNVAEEFQYAEETGVSNASAAFDAVKFEVYHDAKIVCGQIR
jgi:hypothetical protein